MLGSIHPKNKHVKVCSHGHLCATWHIIMGYSSVAHCVSSSLLLQYIHPMHQLKAGPENDTVVEKDSEYHMEPKATLFKDYTMIPSVASESAVDQDIQVQDTSNSLINKRHTTQRGYTSKLK